MAKWTFFGVVRPERFPVTWGTPLSGSLNQPDLGVEADFRIAIHAGQVIVNLTITKGEPNLDSMRNIALSCAHDLTDLVGYASGCYFDVDIISAVSLDTDEWCTFGVQIPVIANRQNPHRGKAIDADLVIASSELPARIALRNFQLAMRDAEGTGFYCYRAIEAMMQSMKSDQIRTDKDAWQKLTTVLSLDRSVSDWIKSHADFPRHGKPFSMGEPDRAQIFELTDEILHRYLEYVRRGLGALPADQFPVLRVTAPE